MQFSCDQQELLRRLQMVERAVPTRDTMPILTGIYLEIIADQLVLRATDLELGIETQMSVTASDNGSFVLEAKYLIPLVRRLPPGDVTFQVQTERHSVEITAGSGNFHIHLLPADDYPSLPTVEGHTTVQVPAGVLHALIRQTAYAAIKDQSRSVLTGVLIECSEGELRFVATDTSRLSFNRYRVDSSGSFRAIAPARTLIELTRLLPVDLEALVRITIADNQILFASDEARLISRLLEGKYPEYQRVIPADSEAKLTVSRSDLLAALERASLMAKKGPAVVTFDVKEGILNMTSQDAEIGVFRESLSVDQAGADVKAAFQARFFIDMLRTVEDDTIQIGITSGLNPTVIRPQGNQDYVYVVMPIRVA